jgi:hypothetical protein
VSTYREAVSEALAATVVHSGTAFSWLGDLVQELIPSVERAMPVAAAREYLRFKLQATLYNNFSCPGRPVAFDGHRPVGSRPEATAFVERLARANRGRGCRERVTVVRLDAARPESSVVVRYHGLLAWAPMRGVEHAAGDELRPGTQVTVLLPKELVRLFPGFYMALGDEGLPLDRPLVRVYWNLHSDAGPRLVEAITTALNRAGVPFRLKVVSDPRQYDRCDAGVLYLLRRDYKAVADQVKRVYVDLQGHLEPRTPAFTRALAPGLGLAEDPGGGESFGMHRCLVLAEGLIRACEANAGSLESRMAVVESCFRDSGVSLDKPYLSHGSQDEYDLSDI